MRKKIYFIILLITTISYLAPAEEPVYFADANLKAAVEKTLGVTDPTPTDMLGLTSLSAHSSGISNLTGLEFAANLGVVGLCRNQISDISPLSGLTKLSILKIFSNQISDISPLAGLTDLEWIDLSDNRISNISVLSGLTRLERLWLNINLISDISPLSELKNLQWLVLHRNQISDVSPLSELTSLQELSLIENQISDISPLSGLTSLKGLTLHSNQISDISALSELTNLERTLWLGNNQISDISPLSGLTNLQELLLTTNRISEISPLYGLKSLERLKLGSNQISDISPLAGLSNLQDVSLGYNQVSDISPLSGLTSLQDLYLGGNQISDLSPLSTLPSLRSLYLSHSQISDLSPLSGLTGLQVLILEHNQISDISLLSGLTSLGHLYLRHNQISDLSSLSGLTSLERLYLSTNQVRDISPIAGLTNLQFLELTSNQVSDLSPLSRLTSLERLYLSQNQIRDLSPIAGLTDLQRVELNYNQVSDVSPLSGLTSLRDLYLHHNQISDLSPFFDLANLEVLCLWANPLDIDAYTIHIPLFESYGTTVLYDPLVRHTLTTDSTAGGSVTEPGEGNFEYASHTVVNISAVAAVGYSFTYWTGTAVDAGKVADPAAVATTITMEADYTLQANFRQIQFGLYVDDDAPNDPGAGNPEISDKNEDGSREHPFDTIQEAIDAAEDGYTVLVYPGIYQEEISFLGKAISVQGVATSAGIPVLENPEGIAVSFYYGEGFDSILKNFVIRNSVMAVYIIGSSPTISNITFVDNKYGIGTFGQAEPNITNCIFWNNSNDDLLQCQAHYSCIERGGEGEGNINVDPLFVEPNNGDYHLRSKAGRYSQEHHVWILDNSTSSCIDAGDPSIDPSAEPLPNGSRINIGAYGGTAFASMSE